MLNNLHNIWSRLGVAFDVSLSKNLFIDLEDTLIQTAQQGREDSRLLFGMRGWLLKHHDLVNCARLVRKLKAQENTAVLGAIVESVVVERPRSFLRYVTKYCQPLKKKEILFFKVSRSKILSKLNKESNHPIWKKWGLISREMGDMKGAIREKSFVLKHNLNLAIRALFGPNLKAEILSYFIKNKQGHVYQIAKMTGFSYQPVYSELDSFNQLGLLKEERMGRKRVFRFNSGFFSKILLAPFCENLH